MAKPGRGGRRGRSGAGVSYSSGELVLPDGSTVEYDGKLTYNGDDAALSGIARQNITSWEARRGKNKVEYAFAVGADGQPIGTEIRGSKGSVRVPRMMHATPDSTFTHIHPRGDGMLGGTFSGADLHNFGTYNNKTCRARAKEGTYSISKTGKFDKDGFLQYVRKADSDFDANYRARARNVAQSYTSGKISYNDYLKQSAKAFNTSLIELHNYYAAGQKKYGYTYTLEKNK